MYLPTDHPTSPLSSPYQQYDTRPRTMLESSYPSPAQHDYRTKFSPGLGLCQYQSALNATLPPSPQPSESWAGHLSTGASPMTHDALADPWSSGAFDYPVVASPRPWTSAQVSPRPSLSPCIGELSIYSHEETEDPYAMVKLESPGWGSESHFSTSDPMEMDYIPMQRHTMARTRLNSELFPCSTGYLPSLMSEYDAVPTIGYGGMKVERASSEESSDDQQLEDCANPSTTRAAKEPERNRRHTDPAHATFHCPVCPAKGFARKYNFNQHMLTHNRYRRKDNLCRYPSCGKEFVRKTDLIRHDQSVHQKAKPFKCSRCSSVFSRKDTLRRHEDDGCPRRHQVVVAASQLLSHPCTTDSHVSSLQT